MRSEYQKELDILQTHLLDMAAKVNEGLQLITTNLTATKKEDLIALEEKITILEESVHDLERNIDRRCVLLLLQQQPVARDLRYLTVVQKINRDLLRISMQSLNVSQILVSLHENEDDQLEISHITPIVKMAELSQMIVYEAVQTFALEDKKGIEKVLSKEEEMDNLFKEVYALLIKSLQNNCMLPKFGLDILLMGKYFEKIGDHAAHSVRLLKYLLN